jgi:hypothetical protein
MPPLFGDAYVEYAEQLGTVGGDVLRVAVRHAIRVF